MRAQFWRTIKSLSGVRMRLRWRCDAVGILQGSGIPEPQISGRKKRSDLVNDRVGRILSILHSNLQSWKNGNGLSLGERRGGRIGGAAAVRVYL